MMNPRILIAGTLTIATLAMLVGIAGQRRELAALRSPSLPTAPEMAAPAESTPEPVPPASPELLRLRSQVTQLQSRKRELAGARDENEQLRNRLAAQGTNAPAGPSLPPDYIRRKEARWVGADKPENTVQSFLWALEKRDLTNLLQVVTPESGQKLLKQVGNSPEMFFEAARGLPGMRVFNPRTLTDGSMEADVEIMPGESLPDKMHFKMIDGQWKLELP